MKEKNPYLRLFYAIFKPKTMLTIIAINFALIIFNSPILELSVWKILFFEFMIVITSLVLTYDPMKEFLKEIKDDTKNLREKNSILAFIYYRDSNIGRKELEGGVEYDEFHSEIEDCIEVYHGGVQGPFGFEYKPMIGDVITWRDMSLYITHPKGKDAQWEKVNYYVERVEIPFTKENYDCHTSGFDIIISKVNPLLINSILVLENLRVSCFLQELPQISDEIVLTEEQENALKCEGKKILVSEKKFDLKTGVVEIHLKIK